MYCENWILTDNHGELEEYKQFVYKISDTEYYVVEHDVVEQSNEKVKYIIKTAFIDLSDYEYNEILDYLECYGYTELQDNQIMAECIAEQDAQIVVCSSQFIDVINWEMIRGIDIKRLIA